MIINKFGWRAVVSSRIMMKFGGAAPPKAYDWRDDPTSNPSLFVDPRMAGVKSYEQFSYPHKLLAPVKWQYSHPDNYDQKNLNTAMTGYYIPGKHLFNYMQAPTTDYEADIAHEYDYESQDLDFQPESFSSQHFRKKGPMWMWVIACSIPLWYIAMELFYQEWPDEDNWRFQRAPPLNYPDDVETPDTDMFNVFNSEAHRDLFDAGVCNPPFFVIKDGKKVYSKWAGVNPARQPN